MINFKMGIVKNWLIFFFVFDQKKIYSQNYVFASENGQPIASQGGVKGSLGCCQQLLF